MELNIFIIANIIQDYGIHHGIQIHLEKSQSFFKVSFLCYTNMK